MTRNWIRVGLKLGLTVMALIGVVSRNWIRVGLKPGRKNDSNKAWPISQLDQGGIETYLQGLYVSILVGSQLDQGGIETELELPGHFIEAARNWIRVGLKHD